MQGDTKPTHEIIWMDERDFKEAILVLGHYWKRTGEESYFEAEGLDEDDIDTEGELAHVEDEEYYAVVEYYEHPDGSLAEVYYFDEEKTEVSDIRFWMTVDDEDKQRFMEVFKQLRPDWNPDEDDILCDKEVPYKGFLYQKALGRL